MKRLACFLLVILLFGSPCIVLAADLDEIKARGYLKVGINPENEPFGSYDADKNIVGFDVDIIEAIAKMWDVKIKYIPKLWEELIPSLVDREYDVIIAPMTITPKRAGVIAFTLPHFNAGQSVLVRGDETRIKSHEDLTGKRVVATTGTTCEEAARSIAGARVVTVDLVKEANDMVVAGKADAHIMDRPISMAIVKEYGGKLKIVGRPFTIEYYGYAVNKEDTELLMQLNQALTILKANATYDTVLDKWFK